LSLYFSLGTYFIGFLDHKNVHIDTKFVIIGIAEAKIWASSMVGGHLKKKCIYKIQNVISLVS